MVPILPDFDAKTWAGNLIQTIFGRTKPHHEYFNSKHRVKVNFYNVNFRVYASAGLNVKMQKKGWTGIWRKLSTEELRLGWDGLILDIKLPNTPQPQYPEINFGNIKLGSIDFPVHAVTIASHTITKDEINKALNGLLDGEFRSALKKNWTYVFQAVAPGQFHDKENYVRAFRVVYPDKVRICLSRFEENATNANQITEVFDWNVGIKLNWSPNGTGFNIGDFSGAPGASGYEIISGSVYGAAKYGGVWKGARVDKK